MRRSRFAVLGGVAFVALAYAARVAEAQDPRAAADIARAKAALSAVASLVGQWEGDAEARMGPGAPLKVRQSEDITWGASETAMIVRGTGRDPVTNAINYEAVGVIWFDADQGKLRMRTFRDGRSVEPELEIRRDTLVWGFPVPGGRIRYTLAWTAETWHEVGEFVREGAAPVRTIEMRLRRVRR